MNQGSQGQIRIFVPTAIFDSHALANNAVKTHFANFCTSEKGCPVSNEVFEKFKLYPQT